MEEVEILNQDKIRKMVLRVSQFHVYANDLRGVGTEPRCQKNLSINQTIHHHKPGCHGNWG